MNPTIELFRKELLEIALYEDDTVANYLSCIYKYVAFVKSHLDIVPINTTPQHLKQWLTHLKKTDISNSRLNNHRSALKSFFTFLVKMEILDHNPAAGLFLIRKVNSDCNQPIDKDTAFQLLKAIDRTSWIGQRNFMIISCLYALGLRRQELAISKYVTLIPISTHNIR